jgi:hypothetical protein
MTREHRYYRLALVPMILKRWLASEPEPGELGVRSRIEHGAPILVDGMDTNLDNVDLDEATKRAVYRALLRVKGLDPLVRAAAAKALGHKYREWEDDGKQRHTERAEYLIAKVRALDDINLEEINDSVRKIRKAAGVPNAVALKQRRYRINKKKKLSESVT